MRRGGSKRWKYGSFGVKYMRAIDIASCGGDILIIGEEDFWAQVFDIVGRAADSAMGKGA